LEGWNSTIELHPRISVSLKTALILYHQKKHLSIGILKKTEIFSNFFDYF
jgi:hypothetical protein